MQDSFARAHARLKAELGQSRATIGCLVYNAYAQILPECRKFGNFNFSLKIVTMVLNLQSKALDLLNVGYVKRYIVSIFGLSQQN